MATWETGRNTESISTPASFPHSNVTVSYKKSLIGTCNVIGLFDNHWLPIRSIVFLVETIQCKQFRCIYRKKKKLSQFLCAFFKSTSNFDDFRKLLTLIASEFPKLWAPENVVRYMCKKSGLTGPMDRQHGKRAKTLIHSQRQLLYQINWPLQRKLSWKKLLLVTCKILRLFVNTMTGNDKNFFIVETIQCQQFRCIYPKKKKIFRNFLCIFHIYIKFWTFSKKKSLSWLMNFGKYGTRKTWLDKWVTSPVWDDPSTSNIVNGPKHCFNLNVSIFSIFTGHCERNLVGKGHS